MALNINFTKERHPGRWVALCIVIAFLAAAGWFGYKWYTTGESIPIPLPIASADSGVDESAVDVDAYHVDDEYARYVRIPTLGIQNTRVLPVPMNEQNILQFPENINDVGWYDKSSTPGTGGVVVINGHGKGIGVDGAFVELASLGIGSEIIVERGDGEIFTYVVAESVVLPYGEATTTGMENMGKSAESGVEGLNIIAPTGTWLPRDNTFSSRVMLRATLVE